MRVVFVLLLLIGLSFSGEIVMRVDGLACAFCAYGLEKKLKRLPGVEKVEISLNKGLVVMKLREGAVIDQEKLKRLVRESGFTLRSVEFKR